MSIIWTWILHIVNIFCPNFCRCFQLKDVQISRQDMGDKMLRKRGKKINARCADIPRIIEACVQWRWADRTSRALYREVIIIVYYFRERLASKSSSHFKRRHSLSKSLNKMWKFVYAKDMKTIFNMLFCLDRLHHLAACTFRIHLSRLVCANAEVMSSFIFVLFEFIKATFVYNLCVFSTQSRSSEKRFTCRFSLKKVM